MNKKDLATKIHDLLIVREDDGSYILFGKYIVKPTIQGLFEAALIIEPEHTTQFSSLKHAVTWCVFDKNKKSKEIVRIAELDNILGSLDVQIEQHKRLVDKHRSTEDKYIYMAKLSEAKLKKTQALQEINNYIALSKYWQSKKFAENQGVQN